jgi:hypothetical protein
MDVVIGSVVVAVLFTLLAVYLARKSVADNKTTSTKGVFWFLVNLCILPV